MQATIGTEIAEARKALGMSLCSLAKSSKLPKGTISKIENSLSDPQISTLLKISKGLDIRLKDLVANL